MGHEFGEVLRVASDGRRRGGKLRQKLRECVGIVLIDQPLRLRIAAGWIKRFLGQNPSLSRTNIPIEQVEIYEI
jgi:hypothetical protein